MAGIAVLACVADNLATRVPNRQNSLVSARP